MKLLTNHWRALLTAALILTTAGPAVAKNLSVNLVRQRTTDANGNAIGDEWCWAACSKMILDYYGYANSLETYVAHGIGSADRDTWNYFWGNGSEKREKVGIWRAKEGGGYELKRETVDPLPWVGIDGIVKQYSNDEVGTQRLQKTLTAEEIKKEINDRDAPFVRRIGWDGGGGHFTVVYGVADGGSLAIHDPWYGSYVTTDAVARRGAFGASNFTWTSTLTTSKIIDVLFLFDTTGSMGPHINSAKASASTLLDKISTKFKNFRVAVADYKDFADDEPSRLGEPDDYVYNTVLPFTDSKATAQGGIGAVPVANGGDDIPESVYSAVYHGLKGVGIGAWRENPCKRVIIVIGDAEGHNPEPWRGGHNFAEVARIATNPDFPISVHCLWAGTSIKAGNQFTSIAGAMGGSIVSASTGGGTGSALGKMIDAIAATPRTPSGEVKDIFPVYSFPGANTGVGSMAANATAAYLEIQKFDGTNWSSLQLVKLRKVSTSVYLAKKPYALGDYRWRLGFKRPASKIFLPALGETTEPASEAPTDPVRGRPKTQLLETNAQVTFESEYTTFTRILNAPTAPPRITPGAVFNATKSVTFQFSTVPGATRYVLEILKGGEVIKTLKLTPPRNDPGSATLTRKVSGLEVGATHTWRVQGLNYDRPVVDPAAW